jgi:hypothetical protein
VSSSTNCNLQLLLHTTILQVTAARTQDTHTTITTTATAATSGTTAATAAAIAVGEGECALGELLPGRVTAGGELAPELLACLSKLQVPRHVLLGVVGLVQLLQCGLHWCFL